MTSSPRIGKFANLSVVFDPTFRDQVISIDLRHAPLNQALTSLTAATRSFWKVTTPQTVTIIPDTQAKRREYEEEVVRTFYLSNADLKETIDILRIVVDARRLAAMTRHQRHHHQGHARARHARPAASSPPSTRRARKSSSMSSCSKSIAPT